MRSSFQIFSCPPSLKATYDEEKILTVLHNLIKNAIGYTNDRIKITAGEWSDKIRISIQDNGGDSQKMNKEKSLTPFTVLKTTEAEKNGGLVVQASGGIFVNA